MTADPRYYPLLFFAGAALTAVALKLMVRFRVIDIPNDRSSHSTPTPKGGGAGFAAIIGCYLIVAGSLPGEANGGALVTLGTAGLLVAAVGLIDDLRNLSAGIRLLIQVLAAVALLISLSVAMLAESLQMPAAVAAPLAVACLVWMTNLYNFMDGIDGLAACQALLAGGGIFVLHLAGVYAGALPWAGLLVALAVAGFLIFNFPPARIFMGDTGSGFLGFVIAGLALIDAQFSFTALCQWLILLAYFVVDASVTLLTRLLSGQRIYQAHRSHLYQLVSKHWQTAFADKGTAGDVSRYRAHRIFLGCFSLAFLVIQLPVAYAVGGNAVHPVVGLALVYIIYAAVAIRGGAVGKGAGTLFR